MMRQLLIPLSLPLLYIPQVLASTVLHDIPPTPTFHVRRQYSDPDVTTSIDWRPDPTWDASTVLSTDSDATPSFHPEALAIGSDPDLTLPRSTLSPASSVPSNKLAASATTSLIHITALPAATTPSSKHRRLRHIKPFNTAYLAPIFALLGLSLGAIAGALLVRLRRYRQMKRGRVDSLEPGPKYTPPPGEEGEDTSISQNETTEKNSRTFSFLGGRRLERRHSQTSPIPSWHGSKKHGWLKRVLGSHREGTTSFPDTRLSRANDRLSAFSEADPFLRTPHASRAPSSLGSGPPTPHGPVSPARALLSSSPFPPESALCDDEWGNVPHESSMHKSIRRGILEHLKNGHRYRGGHKRADSDLNVEQVADAVRNSYDPVPVVYESPQRGRSLVRSGSIGSGLSMKKAMSAPGFRIVDEDPETRSQGSSWRWALPWSGTPKTLSAEDNLTPVPPRRSLTEKRSPRTSPSHSRAGCSIETSSKEKALEKSSPQVDVSVLPMSPPLVTSPPLQAQLFFGPVPGVVAPLDLNATGNSSPSKNVSQDAQECTKSPNKLQTSREPPLLPFPSSDTYSPQRKKLAKTRSPTTSPHQSKSPSDGAVATPLSPSDRCVALEKVDGILARGWSQRELRGNKSLDPNMFGALPVSRTGEWCGDVLGGIDERLEQMGS